MGDKLALKLSNTRLFAEQDGFDTAIALRDAARESSWPVAGAGSLRRGDPVGGPPNDAALALIETAWLNDVDPQAWLTQVLERIPDCKINCIDELLPWDTEPATEPEADA